MEVQAHGLDEQIKVTAGTLAHRPGARRAGRRHQRLALPRGRRTRAPTRRCSASRPAPRSTDPNRWKFSTEEFYLKSAEEMREVFEELPEACTNTLAVAERCNLELDVRPVPPAALRGARRATRSTPTSSELARGGLRRRYGPSPATRVASALRLRARRHREDGVLRLLPGGLGLHPLRAEQGIAVGPGPRLLGGLARRVLPRHHQRRSDPLRAALRAILEPRADLDARHGHRLRRRPARRGHPLRRRPVRPRPRRPHHHVRDDGRQGGDPRRGPRARHALRRRRPHRQARARASR